ncbi:MAG: MBOAT family protein [Ruminococcaceae bacterium]|nr:MBOAT family protein [Oscillospiraceae bacterium]
MVFSSLIFLYLFLPLCLIAYSLVNKIAYKNAILIALSVVFYAWGEPVYVLLMIASALVNYSCGLMIGKAELRQDKTGKKLAMILAIIVDLGALGFFKYAGFLVENVNALTGLAIPAPQIALPIGISFYTFQALTYVIDVYRGEVKVQKSYANFLMYLILFPQLIAGPIVRYSEIEPQITERSADSEAFFSGINRFCIGLGKKILIANYCGSMASQLLDGNTATLTTVGAWLGILLYTFQIYFDFSGYSDMAIGMGRMFGFKYSENFNLPYISTSITEFWRRWHISLSSFFRDYVYIPLGGNRKGLPRQLLNILIVWTLTGLWHGANWNFVLWGMYFAVLLAFEKMFMKYLKKIPSPIRYVATMLLVMFGWTLFYFTDLKDVGQTFAAMFGQGAGWINIDTKLRVTSSLPLIALAAVGSTALPRWCAMALAVLFRGKGRHASRSSYAFTILTFVFDVAILVLSTISLVGSSYNAFLYFRF